MLVIRLYRVGKKNQPSFKIVVTDKKKPPRKGRFVEEVGFYNSLKNQKTFKPDRIKYWLSVGAQPSATIHNMLVSAKIIEGKKTPVHKKSKKAPVVSAPPTAPIAPTPSVKSVETPVVEAVPATEPVK